MKITVSLPANHYNSRKYTCEVLFMYFKDVHLEFEVDEQTEIYKFKLDNGKELHIHDFTAACDENFAQISTPYPGEIPKIDQVQFATLEIDNESLPYVSLFGQPGFESFENKFHLHTDIIAGSFFMLSGFEEFMQPEVKDEHGRFSDEASLAVQAEFTHRPVVNEYIEMLRRIMSKLRDKPFAYLREYRTFVTHDVDEIYRLRPLSKAMKRLGGDLLVRRNLKEAFITLKQTVLSFLTVQKDPADIFDYFMDVSEKYGLYSHFYFICGRPGEEDFQYDIDSPKVKNIIQNIRSRRHHIGFHASYGTPGDFNQFTTELKRLQKVCGSDQKITEGRQHFLRLRIPDVWQDWDNAKLKVDSSMGYHNYWGFRRGICYEYPVFDLAKGEKLNLLERPLIVMEVALKRQFPDPKDFKNQFFEAVNTVRKYDGDFVLLWHNSNINHPYWREHAAFYEELVGFMTTAIDNAEDR